VVLVEVVLETAATSVFQEELEQLVKGLMVELVVLNREQTTTGLAAAVAVLDRMVQQAHLEALAELEETEFSLL
jgi:hypothetical protein